MPTTYESAIAANELEIELLAGKDFSLPAIDFTGSEFEIPDSSGSNALYGNITKLTEADLTTRQVGGTGLFDGLMASTAAHLQNEYAAGRITGSDYAQVYLQSLNSVMSQSVGYLLGKDQAYWQSRLIQMQARNAEIAVINARVALEGAKAQTQLLRIQAETAEIEYAVSKIRLANEDRQHALAATQVDKALYELANMLPAQTDQILAQTANLTSQKAQTEAQTAQITYQTTNLLPAQLAQTQKQTELLTSQKLQTEAETLRVGVDVSKGEYEVEFLLPKELEKATATISSITADTTQTMSA